MSPHIPTDLISLVLVRLPAKTLLRFRCVCKTWRGLIDSPAFVFANSSNDDPIEACVVLSQDHGPLHVRDGLTLNIITEFSCPIRRLVSRCQAYFGGVVLMASVFDRGKKTILWNPSIGKYAMIPSCREGKRVMYGDVVYGLGFDGGSSREFKVLAICFPACWYKRTMNDFAYYKEDWVLDYRFDGDYDCDYDNENENDDDDLLRDERGHLASTFAFAKVYSLKCNTWKRVAAKQYLFPSVMFWGHQVFVSNAIHWIVCKGRRPDFGKVGPARMISFDLEKEIFTSFRLPVYENQRSPVKFMKLVAFRESLALLDWLPGRCCLWVMEGHGVSKTWTRKYSIGVVMSRVLHFKKNGELLFLNDKDEMKSYDIVNEQLRHVPQTCDGLKAFMGSYVESLVLGATKLRLKSWNEFCVTMPEEAVQHDC